MIFLVFFTYKPFLIISPLFFIIYKKKTFMTGVYMDCEEKMFLKSVISTAATTVVKKGFPFFRVFKVNLSLGELKFFLNGPKC